MPLAIGAVGLLIFGLSPSAGWIVGLALYIGAVAMRPWIATPLIVATLPFYLHPRALLGQEISATEAAILTALPAVFARGLVERGPMVRFPRPTMVDWLAAGFVAAALLSFLVTSYPRQSMRELRWLVVEPLMVFYLARCTLWSDRHCATVLWTIVGAGVVASVVGIASLGAAGDLTRSSVRATAPYLSPNHLGMFLSRAGAVALALALFDATRDRSRTWTASASLGVIAIGLVRTFSLGAWGGFLGASLVLAALRGRRALGFAVVGLVLAGAVLLATVPQDRILGRWDPASGTALFRIDIWKASLNMIADHPVLGLGLDNFLYAYQGGYMLPEAWREPNISHPHNWVLDFWIQMGILGLVVVGLLVIWCVRASLLLVRSGGPPLDRAVGAAALGVTATFLLHGSVDNSYFLVDLATLWWVMVALLVIRYPQSEPPRPAASGPTMQRSATMEESRAS